MKPELKRYLLRMILVYGVPFLIMAYALMEKIGDPRVLIGAAAWMVIAGLLTRDMRT